MVMIVSARTTPLCLVGHLHIKGEAESAVGRAIP